MSELSNEQQDAVETAGRDGRMDSSFPGLSLWGKSRGLQSAYPLICHLLDTAAAAQSITEKMLPPSMVETIARHMSLSPDEWAQMTRVLAGWHDIGKASCGFQNFDNGACPRWARGHKDRKSAGRHDVVGAKLVWDELSSVEMSSRLRARVAQVIGGHHGTIPRLDRQELVAWGGAPQVDNSPPAELEKARRWLWDVLKSEVGRLPELTDFSTPAASMTLAVVVLADWIASSQRLIIRHQEVSSTGGFKPELHYERALDFAQAHLQDAGLIAPMQWRRPTPADLIASAEPEWTDLQASISDSFEPSAPGIAVICAPTGEGKTESALLAAERFASASGRNGMFFAMPTVATAEGLHGRLARCIDNLVASERGRNLKRVHSQALLAEDHERHVAVSDESEAIRSATAWMRGTRKSLIAPFGVGTIDQVLLGVLRGKHSPMRIFALATGVLVVDEVHSLDPYMRKLLCRALEWLAALGTPVVVLSATLPHRRVREFLRSYQSGCGAETDLEFDRGGYPSWVAWTPTDGWCGERAEPLRRWNVKIETELVERDCLTDRITEVALGSSRDGGGKCVLVVRSTVAAAQETYHAIRNSAPELIPGNTVNIMHSRLPRAVRECRARDILRRFGPETADRPKRTLLVATQVIEQSFDVDFDILVTESAPLSALLQRAGRVRRHRSPVPGQPVNVKVIWPKKEDDTPLYGSPIYSKAELMGTHACLDSLSSTANEVLVPDDVPDLVDQVDVESDEFIFAQDDSGEAAEATLAQLVRIGSDKSLASQWTIPPPRSDAPLHHLTGHFDTDETHPGTRHQAYSVLVVPCKRVPDVPNMWVLKDGTAIYERPDGTPDIAMVKKVFGASIPVSYPHPGWAGELLHLKGGWDRTAVAQAKLLDVTMGDCRVGGWKLRDDEETGLEIMKDAA